MYPVDLHSHTTRCLHAVGTMEDYVEAAREKGIRVFGFSDHSYWMLHDRHRRYAMLAEEIDAYVADVRRLQAQQQDGDTFRILLGMEMDFIPSRLPLAREAIARHAWDYLIGSVHNIGFEQLQEPTLYDHWRIEDVCELYFHQMGEMIRSGFCDIIAHFDLPKKMGSLPEGGLLPYLEPLLPDLKQSGMAVEINTSGHDSPARAFMPGWEIVECLAASGVPLTLGSDAHAPHQVGRHFDEAMDGLARLGVKSLVSFERRKMRHHPI